MIKPHIKAYIAKNGRDWVAHCANISGDKIQEMGQDIVSKAQSNVASMSFLQSEGALQSEINYTKTGAMSCEVSATSGHSSYIEWGTQFIEKKMPFFWPAYRSVKKALFKGRAWV